MAGIFISCRRTDAGGHAGRLFDRLGQWFDTDAMFYDLDGIDAGDSFPVRLENAVRGASVVLVVVGPDWLTSLNQQLGQPPGVDFLRREVELALARHGAGDGVLVLPVLMGVAAMPAVHEFRSDLRASLGPLCALDVHVFQGKQSDWDHQFVRLCDRIARVSGMPTPRFHPPAGTGQPFRTIEHSLSAHFKDPNKLSPGLQETLRTSGSAAVVARAVLYGMGGVGKTQLALKYSHDYRDHYADVWWFRAESDTSLQLDARDCCEAVNAPILEGEEPSAALKRWLGNQDATWLLVYDNAEDLATLREHLPEGGRHHVIITLRNSAWAGLVHPVELVVWTPEQSADFLAERLPDQARTDLLALAGDLGGLPLALEQAASYLEATSTTVADYHALLGGIYTAGLMLDEGRAATLLRAFKQLSPGGAQLLRLCVFAAPEPLPERFFHEAAEQLPAALAEAAADAIVWNGVAGELSRYGLAERIAIPTLEGEPGKVSGHIKQALNLHQLTQQVTRARLAVPDWDCPALEARQFSWLLDRVASYLRYGPAPYPDALRWFRRAVAVDRQELGEEHPNTLTSMCKLAISLWQMGDAIEALQMMKVTAEGITRVRKGPSIPMLLRHARRMSRCSRQSLRRTTRSTISQQTGRLADSSVGSLGFSSNGMTDHRSTTRLTS